MNKQKLEELNHIINELKTVRKELIVDRKNFLTIETYKCILNNGHTIIREKLLKGGIDGNAAVIVPVTKEGKLLLVVEPRVFTDSTVGIGFPSGYIEKGEDAIQGGLRELLEETGYCADNIEELDEFYQDVGCSAALNKIFIALGCVCKSKQYLDESEFVKFIECTLEEVLALEQKGYIKSASNKLAIERAKVYLKGR